MTILPTATFHRVLPAGRGLMAIDWNRCNKNGSRKKDPKQGIAPLLR